MNLLKDHEHEFADIEQRLRSTYAHVANELGPGLLGSPILPIRGNASQQRKRRRVGVWTPRFATLGAVVGMAFAGFNLANRGPTASLSADEPGAFTSFPHAVPTAPAGYRLDGIDRQLVRVDPGIRTEYRTPPGRLPVTLVVGTNTLYWPPESAKRTKIDRRTVSVYQNTTTFIAEVSDAKCQTILIFGIQKTELNETIKHLRCRKFGGDLRAELSNRKRSDIVFSGKLRQPYARLQFHISNIRTPDYFEITSEPCRCEQFGFGPTIGSNASVLAGRRVFVAPETAPDGSRMDHKSIIWAPTSSALFTLNAPVDWDSTQIEAVIRGVQELDQATFTALLESNGIKELSLLP